MVAINDPNGIFSEPFPIVFVKNQEAASNTMMTVEVRPSVAVPGRKPEAAHLDRLTQTLTSTDSSYVPARPVGRLSGHIDGSIRFLKQSVPPDSLRAAIKIDGDERFEIIQ